MKYRKFGLLDIEISAVGFGAASISGEGGGYGFGDISDQEAIDLVHYAQDMGINLFDTAPIYGFGLSEQRLGKALQGARRDDAFIVSKCGIAWDDARRVRIDNSRETTLSMIEQSLRDLQTERIDLYLVHWPDGNVDIRRPIEVMARAQEEGKLGAIGLSNTNPEDLAKAREIAEIPICQGQHNFFESSAAEGLFPIFEETGIGFMSWGTLAKGILTGRVTPERVFDATDVRHHAPWWTSVDHAPHYETMERLRPLLQDQGHTGLELALSFALNSPVLSTALCGARTRSQLEGLNAALDNLLSPELVAECGDVKTRVFED